MLKAKIYPEDAQSRIGIRSLSERLNHREDSFDTVEVKKRAKTSPFKFVYLLCVVDGFERCIVSDPPDIHKVAVA